MNIGPTEIIVVLIIALLVFGPGRLPQMGRSLGRGVREFKRAADTAKEELGLSEVIDDVNQVKDDVLSAAGVDELKESIAGVTSTIDDAKASVGLGEITAGVGSVKSAMSFDPKKAVKGLVTGKPAKETSAEAAEEAPAAEETDRLVGAELLAGEELVPAAEA